MSVLRRATLPFLIAACAVVFAPAARAQVAGQNVNMVSGTSWPGGDPFLQRQNEPSMAVSTRNPMHVLAGANDYRTVDLETVLSGGEETGDAWLGLFKSFDGGLTWRSTLLPGCPYADPQCTDTTLRGFYQAGADPVVRAGTNGMFYYAGLAFDRATASAGASTVSSIFIARYNDLNNNENADPITYIDTHIVASGNHSEFLDKPAMAVDIPRSGALTCSFNANEPGVGPNGGALTVHQSFAAGNVYITYTDFLAGSKDNATQTHLMFTRSTDCGVTWSTPVQLNTGTTTSQGSTIAVNALNGNVYVAWRQFKSTGVPDAIMIAQSTNAGRTFGAPVRISTFTPFDQGTTNTSIRTNAYPSLTTDMFGFVYVAFSAKGLVASGDARVVVAGSIDGTHWTPAIMVDNPSTNAQTNPSGRGHQIMPAMTFANGRLTLLYYDLRLDHYENVYTEAKTPTGYTAKLTPEGELPGNPSKVFTPFIDDAGLTLRRHTLDLRVLQLGIFPTVVLGPSVLVSQYAYGCCVDPSMPDIEQFKFNVPNLPIFSQGEVPFLGDYIDVVPTPQFVPSGSSWAYNFTPSVNPLFHATWTDNRDVVPPPANVGWTHYTPPVPVGTRSVFNNGATLPACATGQEGMRNQNIYTAQITGGLIVGTPGNSKPLGTTKNPANNQTVPFQRAFAVEAQNVTSAAINVRFSIANQPTGGKASFLQFSQQTTLDVTIPAFSSVSRSVFVTSTNAQASVTVNVTQINSIGGSTTTNGLSQSAVLNPDITNPNITNPNITNPNITNPNITNLEVTNPNITNPNITNPNITNPNITNPNITNPNITNPNITNPNITNVSATNPNITNPNITNPDITNPNITNPNITNPNITNGSIEDVIYPITNNGNTTATYTVQVAANPNVPTGILLQLILNKLYQTPTAIECQLTTETHWETVANITNPKLYATNDPKLGNPNITNAVPNEASITLAPGETAYIDFRVISTTGSPINFNPINFFTPVTVPQAVNTQTALANPGGLPIPSVPALIITTPSLPDAVTGQNYNAMVAATGGNPGSAYTFSVDPASLPTGLSLTAATGVIAGTATIPGTYNFTIQVKDTAVGNLPQHTSTQMFTIHVASPVSLNPGALAGTTPLTGGTQGTPYNQTISAVGGLAPVTISLTSGSVPAGLNFNNGAITGTPTGTGLSTFTVRATDSSHPAQTFNSTYTINIVSGAANAGSILWVNQPVNSTGGQLLGGSPVSVQVFDNAHAILPGVDVVMSFSGTPPCSAAVLSGTVTRTTDQTGTATFNNLSIDRGQLGYRLLATVVSTTISASSNAFRVSGFCATTNPMSAVRSNHVAVKLSDGRVLVAGGNSTGGTPTNTAEIYSPGSGFSNGGIGPMQNGRASFTGTLLTGPGAGKVLAAGGLINGAGIATVELFNPNDNSFSPGSSLMHVGRYQHTATPLPNGDVLIAGGSSSFGSDNNNAEIYHAADGTFSSLIPMTSTHTGGTATLLSNGKILIAGGLTLVPSGPGFVETAINVAELFDPTTNTFTATGPMHTARSFHIAVLLPNGKVLVAGGVNASNTSEGSAELYDPSLGTFSTTGSMTPRGDAAAALLPNGKVLVIGGGAPQSNVAQLYDPVAGTFSNILPMLNSRADFPAVLLNDGTVLATGGFSAPNVIANAEIYYPDLGPLSIATTSLPNGLVGAPYTATISTIGGTTPISFSVTQASFPPGLFITMPATGLTSDTLTGTPSTPGTYNFFEAVSDSGSPQQNAQQNYTVIIANPLSITTTTATLANAVTQQGSLASPGPSPYSFQLQTAGGVGGATTFSIVSGALPPDITLSPSGLLSSSASVQDPQNSTFNFTVKAVSAGPPSSSATQALTLTVVPRLDTATSNNLPGGTVGVAYSQDLVTTGGVPPVSYQYVNNSGAVPPGLSISQVNNTTGRISGTPTAPGTYTFQFSATDSSRPPQGFQEAVTIVIGGGAPPPGTLAFTTQPTSGNAGQPLPSFTVNLSQGGNPVNGATVALGFANAACSSATLSGTTSLTTDGAGNATFSDVRVDQGSAGFTLSATATAPSAGASSNAFNVTSGFCATPPVYPAGLLGGTPVTLASGKILIFNLATPSGPSNRALVYDPSTNTYAATGGVMTAARVGAVGVLLPNGKVLIAGGDVSGDPTNTAELFDPTAGGGAGAFTATPNMGTNRDAFTATLSGLGDGPVVIIGGLRNVGLASIEIYEWQSNTFSPAPTHLVTPRWGHTATLLGTGGILVAGGSTGTTPNASGEIFMVNNQVPASGGFVAAVGNMTVPRTNHSAVRMSDGRVLIVGGTASGSDIVSTAEIFDPAPTATTLFGSFGLTSYSTHTPHVSHSSVLLPDNTVLVVGGVEAPGADGAASEIFDPLANEGNGQLNAVGNLSTPREATAVLAGSGNVFVAGGTTNGTGGGSGNLYYSTPIVTTPGLFSGTAQLINARTFFTATTLGNGKVLVTGGWDAFQDGNSAATAELFDPVTRSYTITGSLLKPRVSHTATALNNGRVLVAGGTGLADTPAEIYDPASGTFSGTTPMQAERSNHTATLLQDHTVLLTGGYANGNTSGSPLNSAEIYDPTAGTFSTIPATMTSARANHTATLLDDGRVLLAGGDADGTAELYDPATHTFVSVGNLHAIRYNAVAVALSDGTHRVLIAGGSTSPAVGGGPGQNSAEIYNPAAAPAAPNGTLIPTGNMNFPRASFVGAPLGGKALVAGGDNASLTQLQTVEIFDSSAGTFAQTGQLLITSDSHALATLNNGQLLIVGGEHNFPTSGTGVQQMGIANSEIYLPVPF